MQLVRQRIRRDAAGLGVPRSHPTETRLSFTCPPAWITAAHTDEKTMPDESETVRLHDSAPAPPPCPEHLTGEACAIVA